MDKTSKKPAHSSIISSLTHAKPLVVTNPKEDVKSDEIKIVKSSTTKDRKQKGKNKNISFLSEIIITDADFTHKGQLYVSEKTADKVKLLSSLTGIHMINITDSIILKFINDNSDNINSLAKSKLL